MVRLQLTDRGKIEFGYIRSEERKKKNVLDVNNLKKASASKVDVL
jgi:hypothetical protein